MYEMRGEIKSASKGNTTGSQRDEEALSVFGSVYVRSSRAHQQDAWAGNKARQKMRRGWWLVRWLGTGMAILSLLTHSWGQDTEEPFSTSRPNMLTLLDVMDYPFGQLPLYISGYS
ncbi:hypothetical protein EYF80_032504 [Liparis tanakae]|uniref:Uncharacterized protein n=1 Tax=Liparis tanakae TaxID=230148 RepID=A0A4Z2GW42_9TELE|nr:hypothetical protein EYF80_032504 [Liparis tanakae]